MRPLYLTAIYVSPWQFQDLSTQDSERKAGMPQCHIVSVIGELESELDMIDWLSDWLKLVGKPLKVSLMQFLILVFLQQIVHRNH